MILVYYRVNGFLQFTQEIGLANVNGDSFLHQGICNSNA